MATEASTAAMLATVDVLCNQAKAKATAATTMSTAQLQARAANKRFQEGEEMFNDM